MHNSSIYFFFSVFEILTGQRSLLIVTYIDRGSEGGKICSLLKANEIIAIFDLCEEKFYNLLWLNFSIENKVQI
jgi:hypothetical protein